MTKTEDDGMRVEANLSFTAALCTALMITKARQNKVALTVVLIWAEVNADFCSLNGLCR